MKLIDLLVQELPKRGGWCEDATYYVQDADGETKPGAGRMPFMDGLWLRGDQRFPTFMMTKADDWETAIVTREQYEAALSAYKATGWDGEGLPPVGCECEVKRAADWMPVTIKFISDYHTVFTTFIGTEDCYLTTSLQFRPILSEADRKREEVIASIYAAIGIRARDGGRQCAIDIYESIVAGKIPGIRIDQGGLNEKKIPEA